jgi:hypothetical protein
VERCGFEEKAGVKCVMMNGKTTVKFFPDNLFVEDFKSKTK